jgi:hypothetical protein
VLVRGGVPVSFDFPDSTFTAGLSINDDRFVAGRYVDKDNVNHGYVGHADKTGYVDEIHTFDVQGAFENIVFGMNDDAEVVGWYRLGAPPLPAHGYAFTGGSFCTIDIEGAFATLVHRIANPACDNPGRSVIGEYRLDPPTNIRGFLLTDWSPDNADNSNG